jgi:DNA polymerase-3 subunit alpha
VQTIVEEREANGFYTSVADLIKRNISKSVGKKVLENLAYAGAFDCFENIHRAQYVEPETEGGPTFLEKLVKFGQSYQAAKDSVQVSLFGDAEEEVIVEPEPPMIPRWENLYQLTKEKEVVGIYLSGHPLDEYRFELKYYFKTKLGELSVLANLQKMMKQGGTYTVGGFVKNVDNRTTKDGRPYSRIILEDYSGEFEFSFYREDYVRFSPFLVKDSFITISFTVEDASRWKGEGEVSIKVKSVDALKNIKNQVKKTLLVKVNARYVSDESLEKLTQTLDRFKGKSKMTLGFVDPTEKISVVTKTLDRGVNISEELLEEIENIPNIGFGIS